MWPLPALAAAEHDGGTATRCRQCALTQPLDGPRGLREWPGVAASRVRGQRLLGWEPDGVVWPARRTDGCEVRLRDEGVFCPEFVPCPPACCPCMLAMSCGAMLNGIGPCAVNTTGSEVSCSPHGGMSSRSRTSSIDAMPFCTCSTPRVVIAALSSSSCSPSNENSMSCWPQMSCRT